MTAVLIVDDNESKATLTSNRLKEEGFETSVVCEDYVDDFYAKVEDRLHGKVYDFLVLDIHFPTDNFGGFQLYDQLNKPPLRNRWGHTLLHTRYASANLDRAVRGEERTLRDFAERANIPLDCVFENSGREGLVAKILELKRMPLRKEIDGQVVLPDVCVLQDWKSAYAKLEAGELAPYRGKFVSVHGDDVEADADSVKLTKRMSRKHSIPEANVVSLWVEE